MRGKLAQKKDGWCGPAALSYALRQQGVIISQKKIAKETGTTKANGVNVRELANFAKKQGMKVKTTRNGRSPIQTLKMLDSQRKKGNSVVVDYLSGRHPTIEDGHYSVLDKVTKDKIKIWDSWTGRKATLVKKNFIKNWKTNSATPKVKAVTRRSAMIIGKA